MNGFPEILRGSVWHTTTPDRYKSIIETGFILPEPAICESKRWGTAMGASHFPFVRSIGGVSLFDFRKFNEVLYSNKYPISSWREFVPCSHRSDEAIWIEINLVMIEEGFIGGESLLSKWKASEQLYRKIMPIIEAAHIGSICTESFMRVLLYRKSDGTFSKLNTVSNNYA